MNRLIPTALLFLLFHAAQAQQVPNGSFENWNNTIFWEYPDTFYTSSPSAYIEGATPNVTKSTDAHSGTYAAKLKTVLSSSGDTIAAMLSLGKMSDGFGGGLPYTAKPDSASFWAKHSIAAGDTAVVMFAFQNQGVLGGFMIINLFGNIGAYTQYKAPIQWFMQPTTFPDTVIMLFLSAGFDGPKTISSEIWIDDIAFSGSAPQIPNNGLEDWTVVESNEPDLWSSLNPYVAITGSTSVTRSNDSYHGSYAARMESVDFFGDTMGLLFLGRLGDGPPSGGMKVTQNPKSLHGFYKYTPVGPDTALAGLFSYRWDAANDTLLGVEQNIVRLPPASSYQPFTVNLSYNGWPRIDSLSIAFASGNFDGGAYVGLGSVLLVDSLTLQYHPVGIGEAETSLPLKVFPIPANDYINVVFDAEGPALLELYSMTGQKVFEEWQELQRGHAARFTVNTVASGDYIFRIRCGQATAAGKINISH